MFSINLDIFASFQLKVGPGLGKKYLNREF